MVRRNGKVNVRNASRCGLSNTIARLGAPNGDPGPSRWSGLIYGPFGRSLASFLRF